MILFLVLEWVLNDVCCKSWYEIKIFYFVVLSFWIWVNLFVFKVNKVIEYIFNKKL